eukprot:1580618-Prorocentrum_lima.AAC.1
MLPHQLGPTTSTQRGTTKTLMLDLGPTMSTQRKSKIELGAGLSALTSLLYGYGTVAACVDKH